MSTAGGCRLPRAFFKASRQCPVAKVEAHDQLTILCLAASMITATQSQPESIGTLVLSAANVSSEDLVGGPMILLDTAALPVVGPSVAAALEGP
jgi:hypothetical protein